MHCSRYVLQVLAEEDAASLPICRTGEIIYRTAGGGGGEILTCHTEDDAGLVSSIHASMHAYIHVGGRDGLPSVARP